MAINKKLIHFKNKQTFNLELANNNILNTSIVFIQETLEIYTHGLYYTCKDWSEGISNLLTQINTLVSGNASTAIESFNEIIVFLENIEDSESLDGIIAGIELQIATKQEKITDLETIRSGAAKGATALLSYTETDPVFKASAAAGIKASDITNWNSKTSNTGTITGIKMNGASKGTSGVVDLGTVLTEHQDISGKLDSEVASDIYLKKTDAANTYLPIGDYATKTEIPIKVSQLENDVPYALKSDVEVEIEAPNGVYAITADGKLIDYNLADTSALGVALVVGEHKFMIAKADATNNGSNYNLYYDYDKGDLSLTNYSKADGTNNYGYLGGSSTPQLSQDFTTWTAGALSDFNGKSNTQVIAAASSSNTKNMCKVLETFNAGSDNQGHSDWYVPAAGQLALMYLAKTDINAALAKIGGTAFNELYYYWSSSEYAANYAWSVNFDSYGGVINYGGKDTNNRVRFIRDISVKPLKERVSELESKIEQLNAVLVDTEEEADDPENVDEIIQSDWNETDFTSGAYIKNKPTIPSESTVSEWGFTKNTGTYSKPSTGIPKSDLASEVLASLGKADTALQSYTEQYKGTITGVSANGTSVATSGVANIPAASTSKYGVTKLSSATNSTSTSLAATASAVKTAYDLANGRQAKLVSGTNIKTINGNSILGSGNLEIGGSSAYPRVDHGATNTTFSLSPNTFYVWDEVASLNLSFTSGNESVTNEYLFQFVSGGIPATLSLPDGIQWIGGEPSIEANKTYQVSILNGIGVIASVGASVRMIQFVIERYINGPDLYSCENGMTWKQWVNSEYNTSGWEDAGNTISLGFDYVLDIYIDDVIIEDHTYTCEFND